MSTRRGSKHCQHSKGWGKAAELVEEEAQSQQSTAILQRTLSDMKLEDLIEGGMTEAKVKCLTSMVRDTGTKSLAMKLLDRQLILNMSKLVIPKAGTVAANMLGAGYSVPDINKLVTVLFTSASQAQMLPAWGVICKARNCGHDGSGRINMKELGDAMAMMGEHITQEKLEQAFYLLDEDRSGWLEFDEFCALMRQLNPSARVAVDLSCPFRNVAVVLDQEIQRRIHPIQKKKCGKVIANLLHNGYSEMQTNAVCRAAFTHANCPNNDPVWKASFEVFDRDNSGSIDFEEVKKAFRLMGEEMSDARVAQVFKEADEDNSGEIDLKEFVTMMRHVNPTPSAATAYTRAMSFSAVAPDGAVTETHQGEGLSPEINKFLHKSDLVHMIPKFSKCLFNDLSSFYAMPSDKLAKSLRLSRMETMEVHAKLQAYHRRCVDKLKQVAQVKSCAAANVRAMHARSKCAAIEQRSTRIGEFEMGHRTAQICRQIGTPKFLFMGKTRTTATFPPIKQRSQSLQPHPWAPQPQQGEGLYVPPAVGCIRGGGGGRGGQSLPSVFRAHGVIAATPNCFKF